jgi:hypothetical protein
VVALRALGPEAEAQEAEWRRRPSAGNERAPPTGGVFNDSFVQVYPFVPFVPFMGNGPEGHIGHEEVR